MKHFNFYRKCILLFSVVLVMAALVVFHILLHDFRLSFFIFLFCAVLCVLLWFMDYLHNRYTDNLLEQLTLLIENLVGSQALVFFPETEDTLLSRLQHQLLKLRGILISQNKILESEKAQIKTLISDISHQIKTPVASAKAFAELLNDEALSEKERDEYMMILEEALNKLTFLTDSLIKMSRLESGIINLKPEKVVLNELVLQSVKTVYSKAKEKNVTIIFDCEQKYETCLDFNWTVEAITNVLDNAVKYTQNEGMIKIAITVLPSYLKLDIQDNGSGISEEEQAKIFGRFYRGKNSSGIEGVGIGLYLTRKIVNKQNGFIKVESDCNGSTFSLFFRKTESELLN